MLVLDPTLMEVPDGITTSDSVVIERTASCLVVRTGLTLDENVNVVVSDNNEDSMIASSLAKLYSGLLSTPSRRIAFMICDLTAFGEILVDSDRTTVEIWANDPKLPTELRLLLTSAA